MGLTDEERRERNRLQAAKYRAEHPERASAAQVRYYEKHREQKAAYRAATREKRAAYKARYDAEHREEKAAYSAAHRPSPEMQAVHTAHLRAKKAGAIINDLTLPEWLAVLAHFGRRCVYCGVETISMDHVHALSRGGDNTLSNVVPACGPCNSQKNTKTLAEFVGGG